MSVNRKYRYRTTLLARILRALFPVAILMVATTAVTSPATAAPNTSDAFYTPPADYEATAPGSILRIRPIQASYFQAIPMQVQAWQLLYRTTGADGGPYAAVTTVLKSASSVQPSAILSFQNMTDAVAPHCMPSQILQQGQVPWLDFSQAGPVELSTMANESPMVAAALSRGWAVSVPDFGGIDNHFLSPREPGYVALDGIRAAESFEPMNLSGPDTRAVLWGYSGGGIATAWAAQEQPQYAPELNVVGAALGAPVGDFRAAIYSANGTPIGGALVPVALMGMVQSSPEFAAALNQYLTPAGQQKITDAMLSCTPQNLLSNMGFNANQYLTVSLDQVLADPVISATINAGQLGGSAPTAPVYVYNAIGDEISTIGGVDALVDTYCAGSTPVTYRQEQMALPISGHTFEWFLGAPGALAWLQQRAENPSVQVGCDIESVPATIATPDALNSLGSGIIVGSLRQLLGF